MLTHSNICYIDSEKHARKVKRQRRLKKKQQVDSSADKIADSPSKPAARRKRGSIFDSASEDEDFLAQSEENLPTPVSLAKKTNGKVSEENKPGNVTSNDEAKKRSKSDKKRKSDAINEDPASPMYISASCLVAYMFRLCLVNTNPYLVV